MFLIIPEANWMQTAKAFAEIKMILIFTKQKSLDLHDLNKSNV